MSKWFALLIFTAIGLQAADRVSVRVVLLPHDYIVYCTVPHASENEWLNIEIWQYDSSGIELNEKSPITFSRTFGEVECDSGEISAWAACELFYKPNKISIAKTQVPCVR